MRTPPLTAEQEQRLRDQVISDEQPGTVLHDFGVVLDALSPNGLEAGGKYHLLPIKLIPELDARLSRPLNLELQRPQVRSHPYIQGLNLLLRASSLARVAGKGDKARLVADPEMAARWADLNPTERYFNLLEAWLCFGTPEMVGERSGFGTGMLWNCSMEWLALPEKGRSFENVRPEDVYLRSVCRDFYQLALMDLFGIVAVDQPKPPVSRWVPAGVRHTPFGDALMTVLARSKRRDDHPEDDLAVPDENDGEAFGVWQPLFQPYFPEWRQNLEFPGEEFREGEFVFRVSLGRVWRRLSVPAKCTLDDLAWCILDSVRFDNDHLYEFSYVDRRGATCKAAHPMCHEGPWTDEVRVGELPLQPGESMGFLFDFGDCWRFNLKLERVDPPTRRRTPKVVERHGKAPEQYPNWDD